MTSNSQIFISPTARFPRDRFPPWNVGYESDFKQSPLRSLWDSWTLLYAASSIVPSGTA